MNHTEILNHVGPLLEGYDVLLCDIWGVMHDGERALPASNATLTRFRARGGTVILVSNAPKPAPSVAETLAEKGVVRAAWDEIVSSGDLALAAVRDADFKAVHRIGPLQRDDAFFDHMPSADTPLDRCDAIAVTGLVDDRTETAESYRARLIAPACRKVPLICANPDLVVHVGDHLLACAGGIGELYESLGGPVVWCGKPHPQAYATAMVRAEAIRGRAVPRAKVLAIGDAVRTDLAAARGAGVDALFITSGIHRDEVMSDGWIDATALNTLLADADMRAKAAAASLAW